MKKTGTAYVLFLFSLFGIAGLNRFYVGKIGTGFLWLITWGFFGIGLVYDLFTIPTQVRQENALRNRSNINSNVNQINVNVVNNK